MFSFTATKQHRTRSDFLQLAALVVEIAIKARDWAVHHLSVWLFRFEAAEDSRVLRPARLQGSRWQQCPAKERPTNCLAVFNSFLGGIENNKILVVGCQRYHWTRWSHSKGNGKNLGPGSFRNFSYLIFLLQESAVINLRSYYRSVAHYGVLSYTKSGLEIRDLRCEKYAIWRAIYKVYEAVIMTHPPVLDHTDCCVAEDTVVDQVKALIASVVDLTRSVRFRQASTSNPTTVSQ